MDAEEDQRPFGGSSGQDDDRKESKQKQKRNSIGKGGGRPPSPSVSPNSGSRSKSPPSRSRSPGPERGKLLESRPGPEMDANGGSSSSEEGEVRNEAQAGRGSHAGIESDIVSMSINETNEMRAKLGLRPLDIGKDDKQEKEREAHRKRKEAELVEDPEVIKERLLEAKKRRLAKEQLDGVKGLGEISGEEDEDLEDWVSKTRHLEAEKRNKGISKPVQDESLKEDEADMKVEELAGMKVRHGASEVGEGEMVILTLADQPIIDGDGKLNEADDELEDAARMQEKQRRKAYEDSKPKKDFDEEGKRVSMWDKYDEEEKEAALIISETGLATEVNAQEKHDAIRGKLMEGLNKSSITPVSDFYTPAEMAVMKKPKKKKKSMRRKPVQETRELIAQLEKSSKNSKGAVNWEQDHASHKSRTANLHETSQAHADRVEAKAERFENALSKANKEAARLRPGSKRHEAKLADVTSTKKAHVLTPDSAAYQSAPAADDEDEELFEALNRARRVVQSGQSSAHRFESMAMTAQLQKNQEHGKVEEKSDQTLVFTDTSEFCRIIELADEDKGKEIPVLKLEEIHPPEEPVKSVPSEPKAQDVQDVVPKIEAKKKSSQSRWTSNWVPADSNQTAQDHMDLDASAPTEATRKYRVKKEADVKSESLGVLREAPLGTGIASALGTLRDKGDLRANFEWVGRTNDMKKGRLLGVDDVYYFDHKVSDDRLEQSIRAALTRKDEFGRILTPKEAFRELSYAFHGKCPSKNTLEKRTRKTKDEFLARRANLNQDAQLEQLKQVQKAQKSTHVVLSGKGKIGTTVQAPGSIRDAPKKNSRSMLVAQTPVLGKGSTPLSGSKKVEEMFGIKRKHGADSNNGPHRK